MLISRTMPSKVFSVLKLLRKLNDPPPAAIINAGEISSVLPTAAGSGANALFGAVSGVVVDVTQGTSAPVAAVVHPAGSAGAVTLSKFSLQPGPGGVGVAVGVAVPVGVGVATPAHGRLVIVSTLTPPPETLLSVAILHLSLMLWLLAAAGRFTVVVM